jgi:hypothetical protein
MSYNAFLNESQLTFSRIVPSMAFDLSNIALNMFPLKLNPMFENICSIYFFGLGTLKSLSSTPNDANSLGKSNSIAVV